MPRYNLRVGVTMKFLGYVLLVPLIAAQARAEDCPPPRAGDPALEAQVRDFQTIGSALEEKTTPGGCPSPWHCATIPYRTKVKSLYTAGVPHEVKASVRAGYFPENENVPFKGNVLFYEGLGDSMLNHGPLFQKLADAGYRVVAFDYMGQGGSTGRMDDTRIGDIPALGDLAWKKFARDTAANPERTVIGWSTGGLAAYVAASAKKVDRAVLIAPGLYPNSIVGESSFVPPRVDHITVPTLTTAAGAFSKGELPDPHVDPIRPTSPLLAPDFALDLKETAFLARHVLPAPSAPLLVQLSGTQDNYVDSPRTEKFLAREVPSARSFRYDGALHEIDNEAPSISGRAHEDILHFLSGT